MHFLEEEPSLPMKWHYGIDKHVCSKGPVEPYLWKRLALHLACTQAAVPMVLVDKMIEIYPEAIGISDPHTGDLAIHLACRSGCSEAIVKRLIDAHPGSVKAVDIQGRLPLHHAILATAPTRVIRLLVQEDPSIILSPDQDGRTPLQYAQHCYPSGHAVLELLETVWM